jgi:hypothetical protein
MKLTLFSYVEYYTFHLTKAINRYLFIKTLREMCLLSQDVGKN